MKVEELRVDPEAARELWLKYKAHRVYQKPHDAEIEAIYKQIARGRTVIRALESIRAAGFNEEGLPRLAICPAHLTECWYRIEMQGSVCFGKRWPRSNDRRGVVRMEWPGVRGSGYNHCAHVPLIPVHLRPKRGLQNYHILWEAEWHARYPVDPYLLRRFGADAWLVVAAWDLTDVERAVMAGRLRAH